MQRRSSLRGSCVARSRCCRPRVRGTREYGCESSLWKYLCGLCDLCGEISGSGRKPLRRDWLSDVLGIRTERLLGSPATTAIGGEEIKEHDDYYPPTRELVNRLWSGLFRRACWTAWVSREVGRRDSGRDNSGLRRGRGTSQQRTDPCRSRPTRRQASAVVDTCRFVHQTDLPKQGT